MTSTGPNPPRQNRSIDSTRRMLDAAEDLLREGGNDALTVEAVIERAATSIGAFYARFGSRHGLLVAMHERFLSTYADAVGAVVDDALRQPTLDSTLRHFVDGLIGFVADHRNTVMFHVLQNAHVPEMRAQGNALTQQTVLVIERIIAEHPIDPRPVDVDRVDMVARLLHALSIQMVLFDSDEVTGRAITDRQWSDRVAELVLAYLW